jgi:hypothetical protein
MTHNKLNGRFEFPEEINMKEYTVEYIEKQELLKEIEEKDLPMDGLTPKQKGILETEYPEDYYKYNLKGIVIHLGEANSGHYYSYINDRESDKSNDWFEFNDALVLPFDVDDLDDKAFGGEAEIFFTGEDGEQEHAKTEKSANAYMLFYERKQMYLWESLNDGKEELIKIDEFGKLKEKVNIKANSEEEENKSETQPEFEDLIDLGQSEEKPKDSDYEIQIPQEFANLIQSINMKEWQLKYIF